MGLNSRLVITPLTDRIYLTLTQALTMRLGGVLAGPAGTGKTETIKDLAKALGLFCLVTSCGEGMDSARFGKILSGLAQSGVWGCFDEFNRLDVSHLSVISTQLLTVRTALLSTAAHFKFEGANIVLNHKVGVFITLRPGFNGTNTELPASLKALFRPGVCSLPDTELICQVMLFSEGFLEASDLARKMSTLYNLSQSILSKQCHYDFGLRAIKSVLITAGQLKRESPQLKEGIVLMRTLRDVNMPQLVSEDITLFLGLMKDLFPRAECARVSYPELTTTLESILKENNFEIVPAQVFKTVHLYETMLTRHSVMLVGPTGGGKSVIIDTLMKTRTFMGFPSRVFTLNPKAVSVTELYGMFNPVTQDWCDGLLANIFRSVNRPPVPLHKPLDPGNRPLSLTSNVERALVPDSIKPGSINRPQESPAFEKRPVEPDYQKRESPVPDSVNRSLDPVSNERAYILFDGDVDEAWIENLNSVMDDNKMLTLGNGERIRLQPHCQLLFEVGDLQYASPGTVSRAGIIFVDPHELGYRPFWNKWVNMRLKPEDEELRDRMQALFDKYVPSSLKLISEGIPPSTRMGSESLGTPPLKTVIPQTPLNMIVQLCQMLDASLSPQFPSYPKMSPDKLEAVFILCVYSSLGASLIAESQLLFDDHVKGLTGFEPALENEDQFVRFDQIPSMKRSWFDYTLEQGSGWVPWSQRVKSYEHYRDMEFGNIVVPTVDSTRLTWILGLMNEMKRPCLVVGDTGTSKTATMMDFLRSLSPDTYSQLHVNFSALTSSMSMQRNLELVVEKKTRDVYGPPAGKKLVLFIDDLNLPQVDMYGTQQPIAFLKLLFEKDGLYGRDKNLSWKNIQETGYLCTMGSPGGGRNQVDPRFISLFCLFSMTPPSHSTLCRIFTSILSGHTSDFEPDIRDSVLVIVQITLDLLKLVTTHLPPTPSKFHYTFSVRDLSRITQGLLYTRPVIFKTKEMFIRAWRNEFTRTICDRLSTEEDLGLMYRHISDAVQKSFPPDASFIMRDPLLFGDFRNALKQNEPRHYEDLLDYSAVGHLFTEILEEYNNSAGAKKYRLDLILFQDAREHLTRIHRALRLGRGNCLVLGVDGVGKRSLVTLATFAAGYQLFTINMSHDYTESQFREDLKCLYRLLGVNNQATVFLFSGSQIVDEGFLELINNMLTLGMVAALFNEDEKDAIITSVRDLAKEKGYPDTKDGVWNYFVSTGVSNLHIVACMSPTSPLLRTRCRNFPGLVNNTCVNWLQPWSQSALVAVATKFIEPVITIPETVKGSVITHLVYTHESVNGYLVEYMLLLKRHHYITPKHYLIFIENFLDLLNEKLQSYEDQSVRLRKGMAKLTDAQAELILLNQQLDAQKLVVNAKTEGCEKLLVEINEAKTRASEQKKKLGEKSKEVEIQRALITMLTGEKTESEKSREMALVSLSNARDSLESLSMDDIAMLRSFGQPPEMLQTVAESILILLSHKETKWPNFKQISNDFNLVNQLKDTNPDDVSHKQQQLMRIRLQTSSKSKDSAPTSKTGTTVGVLRHFVEALLEYCYAGNMVEQKTNAVATLELKLNEKNAVLTERNREVEQIEALLKELEMKYEGATSDKLQLEQATDLMTQRSLVAEKLITGFGREKLRWTEELASLETNQNRLIGACLLSAGFLCYGPVFSLEFRHRMMYEDWQSHIVKLSIPIGSNFRVEQELSNEVTIIKWNSRGLPQDELSIQNGILVSRGRLCPLCIDPQNQASSWIKQKENGLQILYFSNPDFISSLETCIASGTPVLFQDVDYVDPVIENLLDKKIHHDQGRSYVSLGDKEIDHHPNFRLYLTTRLTDSSFDPRIYTKTTLIDWSVTIQGLEDHLLARVVQQDHPDLEDQQERLLADTWENKMQLHDLEEKLLQVLNTAGNILNGEELVETLENIKTMSDEISIKLSEAESTSKDIGKLRQVYRPVAKRGAILFFALWDMYHINPMYQYSLESNIEVFQNALKKAETSSDLKDRLETIITTLTKCFYDYACIGLFERHKLLLAFQIAVKLQLSDNLLTQGELDFFIKGGTSLDGPTSSPCLSPWLQEIWPNLIQLASEFKVKFERICEDAESNLEDWKKWYDEVQIESCPLPGAYETTLSEFERMLLVRCFRPDRIYQSVCHYVAMVMGDQFLTPDFISYDSIYKRSACSVPVLFILSPGSDPTEDLMALGVKFNTAGHKFKFLSLGKGQKKAALTLLHQSLSQGYWLVYQNCHLLVSLMSELEQHLTSAACVHPNFRLWLTTEPCPEFPVGILHKCFKVATEPPNGLKQNLNNIYLKTITQDLLDQTCHPRYKDLIYVMAFFHAVLQERRKYGKMGWNICYDFNGSDFTASVHILSRLLDKTEDGQCIPWETIKRLIGEVVYGGKVSDIYDRRCVLIYLDEYLGEFTLESDFQFYPGYRIPPIGSKQSYLNFIEERLPSHQSSELFGLDLNVEIDYYTKAAEDLLSDLIIIQPQSPCVELSEMSREQRVDELCANIMNKLPREFDLAQIRLDIGRTVRPTLVVLLQELNRFNVLVARIKTSLGLLRKALAGELSMDSMLDTLSHSLFKGEFPKLWRTLAPPTCMKLASWMIHFQRRYEQYVSWIRFGDPVVMWLAGLHIPQSYLIALIQTSCHSNGWSLDRTTMSTRVTQYVDPEEVEEPPDLGCYISGLYLQGAHWDSVSSCLVPPLSRLLIEPLPILAIVPIEAHHLSVRNSLRTPLYSTTQRSDVTGDGLVMETLLSIDPMIHDSLYVLRGVALILNPD
uniref:Dynein heavy chain 10, axonemal n=1 Tax=Cacopsylla melanoneura TaxID=428564 RepID=A0A8D9AKK0_9HEMI